MGYIIKTIDKNEDDKEYRIIIVSKSGEEVIVNIPEGIMEAEEFSIGDACDAMEVMEPLRKSDIGEMQIEDYFMMRDGTVKVTREDY